jgi:2-aminoadipate transaminase
MQPSAIRAITKLTALAGKDLISFAGGMPNPATFPLDQLADLATEEIRNYEGKSLQYGLTTGYRPLVNWISTYVSQLGVQALPERICCTTGSQQGIDLIAQVMIDAGDFIFVENPTYIGALAVFRNSGASIVSVDQDPSGMVLEDLHQKLKSVPKGKKKLVYIVSNFQNPSGITLSEERRKKLAEMLDEFDAFLIEDDPYGEIYFGEQHRPAAPVKSWNQDRVFYMGTFSKLVAPTFRTGWIVASEEAIHKIELAKEAADLCSSMLDQRILYRFCSSNSFPSHLQRLRSFYQIRCEAMQKALQRSMPEGSHWTQPGGGFFVWVELPAGLDAETLLEESIGVEHVSFIIGRPFSPDNSARNFLRLAFSVENPDRIEEGIQRFSSLVNRRLVKLKTPTTL